MNRKTIAGLLSFITLVYLAALYWGQVSQSVLSTAQQTLAAELSAAWGVPVQVGRMEINSFTTVTIHDVVVQDHIGQPLLSAEVMDVTYNPVTILRGTAPITAILDVSIRKPQLILVQHADQTWNIEDIIRSNKQSDGSFTGKVRLIGGQAAVHTPTAEWQLEALTGSLDFAAAPSFTLDLSVETGGTKLAVSGAVSDSDNLALHVLADRLALQQYNSLVPVTAGVQLTGGALEDIELSLQRSKGIWRYGGSVRLAGAAAALSGIPITETTGWLDFDERFVYISTAAKIQDQPVVITGNVAIDGTVPVLNLLATSAQFRPSVFAPELPLAGDVAFKLNIQGPSTAPSIDGTLRLPAGAVGPVALQNAAANVHISLKTSQSLQLAECYGTVTAAAGDWAGLPLQDLHSSFYQKDSQIVIDYLNGRLQEGTFTASGSINQKNLAIAVSSQNLPLQTIGNAFGFALTGSGDVKAQVGGTLQQPTAAVDITAVNGSLLQQPYTQAKAQLKITSDSVDIQSAELRNGVTSHKLVGTVALTGRQQVQLTLTTRQARAENIVAWLAPGERLTGNVDVDMAVSGSLADPDAMGRVVLTEGSFRGQLIARAAANYQRHAGITEIRDFTVDSLNTSMTLNGRVMADNAIDFDLTAKAIDIERLNLDFPYTVAGKADFTGKLSGYLTQPALNGEMKAGKMVFNNQAITDIVSEVSVTEQAVQIPSFRFRQGNGQFQFAGGIDLVSHEIAGNFTVERGELSALLPILNITADGVEGQLNGQIRLGGTLEKPNMWLRGNLTAGKIKKYPLENIEVDIALENNILQINQFTAQQGTGVLAARGKADLNGLIDMEIGGQDIDAGLLTTWFDTTVDARGKLNFAAQISGQTQQPHSAVSLEIVGGGVSNATFDSLYGLFVLDNGSIQVNQLLLSKGNYRASAYGTIPLAALSLEKQKRATDADQMDLKIRLDEADLSILPLLTKEVSWASGPTQGNITISGTLLHPILDGSVTIKDATVKLAALADPIQKVGLDIRFLGDKIDVRSFEGHSGSGGYLLTGGATLAGLTLSEYNLTLAVNEFSIKNKYFQGPLNGRLHLESGNKRPMLSGKIEFDRDTIDIPYITSLAPSTLDMGLDIEVVLGDKMHFYNSFLYDIWASGKIKIAGTTQYPDVSGGITATRGTVSYLRTRFKVKEASVNFTQYRSFEPTLKMHAETQLERTVVTLDIDGPVSTMNFRLASEPAMSQQEILSLLTLRSRYFDKQNSSASSSGLGRDEMLSLLDAGLQMQFVSEVEGAFRRAFGLDEFHLVRSTWSVDNANEAANSSGNTLKDKLSSDRDNISREVYNLEFGKYITDRLLISYTLGVDHNEQQIGFRYDINRRISLTGAFDNQNRSIFGLETRFRF